MMVPLLLVAAAVAALLGPAPCCAGGCARSSGDSRAGRQEATLAALVALHAGADCSSPRPQGARHLAVLKHAVAAVNTHGGGVPIGLRVYDTCSSPEIAVKATLKALVAAEEDTCLLPPFFLGFVGPDDTDSAEAVAKVVHVFNLTHVVPWRLARPAWLRDHTLHVANTRHDHTAQAVLTMMRQAGWTSFLAAHTGSADASRKAKVLLQMAAGSEVCSVSPALHFAAEDVIGKLQQGGRTPSGAVLVADSWSSAADLLSSLPPSLIDLQVLVVSGDTQLPPHLPAAAAANVTAILLQEAAATQLTQDFQDVLSSDPALQEEMAEDMWTAPLAHAVRLYGAALRVAQMLKCPGARPGDACVPADEWHAMVAGASVQADDVSRDAISFASDLPTAHRVYLSDRGSDLRWVGNITDGGKKLHLMSNWSLPAPPSTTTCTHNVEEATVQTSKAGSGGLWPDMVSGHGFYEAVGMMAGAATGLVVLLILCTWIVYRSFRVPGKRRSPASSVSSYTHRS